MFINLQKLDTWSIRCKTNITELSLTYMCCAYSSTKAIADVLQPRSQV